MKGYSTINKLEICASLFILFYALGIKFFVVYVVSSMLCTSYDKSVLLSCPKQRNENTLLKKY